MKTNDKQQTIPMAAFLKAAVKYFKCKPEEVEIRMIEENQEAFVVYKDYPYKISTCEMLRKDVSDMLTHPDHAQHINLSIWVKVTEHSVDINKFLPDLISKLENAVQVQYLQLVLTATLLAEEKRKYRIFWETLANIDRYGDLWGFAIVSVTENYNADAIIDDVTQLMVTDGQKFYNRVVDGIFETVYPEGKRGYPAFYIYSIDDFLPE